MSSRRRPEWWEQAAAMLAEGATVAEVGRACGVRRESVSRQVHDPDSWMHAEVTRRRALAEAASAPAAGTPDLVQKALATLEAALGNGDKLAVDAAKAIVGRLSPPPLTRSSRSHRQLEAFFLE